MLQNNTNAKLTNTFEQFTGAVKQIENDHAYIHQGKYWTRTTKFTLATGASIKFTLQTNSEKEIHYRPMNIRTSADKLSGFFYEGSSGASGGTVLTTSNRNRQSTNTTDVVLTQGVTVTTNGTQISELYIPGATGVGGVRTGDDLSGNNEWVLKADTLYTILLTNDSEGDNVVFIEFQWYEE